MKATEQYFPVELFIMLFKVVLNFASKDEILQCHHSSKSFKAVLSRSTVCFTAFHKTEFGNFHEFFILAF